MSINNKKYFKMDEDLFFSVASSLFEYLLLNVMKLAESTQNCLIMTCFFTIYFMDI